MSLPSTENRNWPDKGHRHWNRHHNNFAELCTCADESLCPLCRLVVELVRFTPLLAEPLKEDGRKDLVQVSIERYVRGNISPLRLRFNFGDELAGLKFRIIGLQGRPHSMESLSNLTGLVVQAWKQCLWQVLERLREPRNHSNRPNGGSISVNHPTKNAKSPLRQVTSIIKPGFPVAFYALEAKMRTPLTCN